MNKKILILNQNLSGVNKYIFHQLREKNWDLTIFDVPISKKFILKALISSFNLNIYRWKQNSINNFLRMSQTADNFIHRTRYCQKKINKLDQKYDLIFQISGLFSPTLNYENLKIPYVTFNDYTMSLSRKFHSTTTSPSQIERWLDLEKQLYQNSSLIFATSENTRMSIINDYQIKPGKVILVKYGVTTTHNYENNYESSLICKDKSILFVGKNFMRKGGYILLNAFNKVKQEIPEAKLIIVSVDKYTIDRKYLVPGVEIYSYIKDRKKFNDLFEQASIFAMPSFSEPFGLVFLEAMSHKLPCIGSNIDAMPEIIEDGVSGFLIKPSDIEDLANKIILLLKNSELSSRMGIFGYERVKKVYNWEEFGNKIDEKLSELINI
jgi:glycosyltransferase involved in cell wall biosynthesis